MRLDKFLSECTALSRKETKKLAKQGIITVNDNIIEKTEMHISENSDTIKLNGQKIEYRKYIYIMMNKPSGYVSAVWDRELPCVTELIPEEYRHFDVFPVGRLDIDTEGLLLLTNDGDFNHRLTSPKSNIYKKYFARLSSEAEEKDIEVFKNGIEFSDFTSKPAFLEICKNKKEVFVSICEGKFHHVKRMFAHVGNHVEFLKRVSVGGLLLDRTLALGEVKILTEEDLKKIYE